MLQLVEVGDFKLLHHLASGWGGTVHLASNGGCVGPPTVAVKYPTNHREVHALEALNRESPCLGVPQIYGSGSRHGKPFVGMDLLRAPLPELLREISPGIPEWRDAAAARWARLRPLGRLLLRRLEAIHKRGFVHCDIKPSNVAIGLVHGRSDNTKSLPFFIDFGLAHRHPGGEPVRGHAGTLEYSSVRSADGGPRLPLDDVETLGWMLLYGAVGDLPWFPLARRLREFGKCDRGLRDEHCRRVQRMKLELVESSAGKVEGVAPPPELLDYLRLCRKLATENTPPDYAALARLLGGSGSCSQEEAEREDLDAFHAQCLAGRSAAAEPAPAPRQRHPEEPMPPCFLVGTWNDWKAEEMPQDNSAIGTYRLEVRLPRDGGEFQILEDGDWKRALHPARRRAGLEAANPVLGPDAEGHGLNWAVNGQAGDVIVIKLQRPPLEGGGAGSGAQISWARLRHSPLERRRLAAAPRARYFAVGSWDAWAAQHEMAWSGDSCRLVVRLGGLGRESFQILENGDWERKLHPSTRDATPHESHMLLGPGKHGHGKNWMIGGHRRDRAEPSAFYEVRLLLLDGSPCRVQWARVHGKAGASGGADST